MTPEEIVAAKLERQWAGTLMGVPEIAELQAKELLAALREAGYRIVRQHQIGDGEFGVHLPSSGPPYFRPEGRPRDVKLPLWVDVEDGAQ